MYRSAGAPGEVVQMQMDHGLGLDRFESAQYSTRAYPGTGDWGGANDEEDGPLKNLPRIGTAVFACLARGAATLRASILIAAVAVAVFAPPPATAQSATDIVGGWLLQPSSSSASDVLLITFTSDGKFYGVQDEVCCGNGVEYGTYAWTPTTGALTYAATVNTDGDLGLAGSGSNSGCQKAVVSGNALTLSLCGNPSSFTLTRVASTTSPIVGSWYVAIGTANDDRVFTFLSDGTYLSASNESPARDPLVAKGIERGTYTWNASSGALTHATTVNTDGQGGLSHSMCKTAVVSGNSLTLTCASTSNPTAIGSFTAARVGTASSGTTTPSTPTLTTPLPPPPAAQTAYTVPSGRLPTAAVSVDTRSSTYGNATLIVSLDLSRVLSGGSFAGLGQFAAGYNIYVAALAPAGVLGLTSATWFVLPASGNWAPLGSPIAAYVEGLAQTATNTVEIAVLQNLNVTGMVGTEIYIGYGTDSAEMLSSGRYRGVYKVQ